MHLNRTKSPNCLYPWLNGKKIQLSNDITVKIVKAHSKANTNPNPIVFTLSFLLLARL